MALLKNVVGIVSGGASGLGAATVAHIVRLGGRVVVADLPSQHESFLRLATASCADAAVAADTSVSSLHVQSSPDDGQDRTSVSSLPSPANGLVLAFADTDVTNEDQISAALDLAESEFGEPVNVAVSCAGIGTARKVLSRPKEGDARPRVHPLSEFSNALQVNTIGTFNVSRLAAQRMAVRKPDHEGMRGVIINTSSIAGLEGQRGQVAYAASKSAVIGMTLPMARDLAPYGIRVMSVAPGLFQTPLLSGLPEKVQAELGQMVPCPSRLGDPDEFGRLVVSILTNPMLNGETIRLDGALRMPP
eukprot:CAMPEP_0197719910 /NCGR_PEP_ID=MMETSP1434-20131217/3464_1 /TAXON_ID=265543 /ORGANISM="Minutocellus polymorphus, Strain CCMP3303" /LENGTH=303 /DNA_ID=CAMNT_0043304697 /DNA_START=21 /DNA_END=932 /DNA_ORIENTATION=+